MRPRVGILWRGARGAERPAADRGLGPLFDALCAAGVDAVPVPFGDERVEEVRAQLRDLAGLLVWVNPIQDGATRRHVDELLEEAAARGTWVSAHPAVIRKMGTKQVLFETRHLGWGTDTGLYRSADELAERLPSRLSRHGRLVVKQGRGNGGNGVWSVQLADPRVPATLGSDVLVREARAKEEAPTERMRLGELVERCALVLPWSGVLVDQPYQRRLGEGMIRCYFSHDEVVGFARQWPKGLLDADGAASLPGRAPAMEPADAPAYRALRARAEHDWVPEMLRVLGLHTTDLPAIWDADFLFGTRNEDGGDERYVLCEINVSAVWPFPPSATPILARNAAARVGARGAGSAGG
ncbi:MAG: Cj0069 family protein [Actinomycetota bacterium]|nr:Cj0069 family protein [Actinomycetota bacterium]